MRRFLAFAATAVIFGAGGFFASHWLDHRKPAGKPVTLYGYLYWPATTACSNMAVGRGNRPGPSIYGPDGTLLTATRIGTDVSQAGQTNLSAGNCALPWIAHNVKSEPVYRVTFGSNTQTVNLSDVGTQLDFSY
jgi:hypothetical protein